MLSNYITSEKKVKEFTFSLFTSAVIYKSSSYITIQTSRQGNKKAARTGGFFVLN